MKKSRVLGIIALLLAALICLSGCQSKEGKYKKAQDLISEGKLEEAIKILDELGSYEDSSKLSMYAKAIQAGEGGEYDTAISTFQALGSFMDSEMMVTYYTARKTEAAVYDGTWIHGDYWFEAIRIYETLPLFRDCRDRAEACRKAAYDQAVKSGDEGNTRFAIAILRELGNYGDSAKQITYYEAQAYRANGQYSEASAGFAEIPGFRDADTLVTGVMDEGYDAAAALEEAGKLDEANAVFLRLGDYKDAATRAYKLYYDAGLRLREEKDWDGARAAFEKAGDYSDAAEQIKETTYQEASALEASGDQEGAYALFISLGNYSDSFERANKPYYDLGVQKREAGEWELAAVAFKHAGKYEDAEQQVQAAYYSLGEEKRAAQDWDGARAAYEAAGTYYDAAEQVFATYYMEGKAKQAAQDWDGSRAAFEAAGTYHDAAEQVKETTYQEAAACMAAGRYDEAYRIYSGIKGYKDTDNLLTEDENLVVAAAAAREAKLAPYKTSGSIVTFGTYPQTAAGNDRTPIEWIVLDYDEAGHRALLLSRYGLDTKPYHSQSSDVTWETCYLRAWLNNEFLNKTFSTEERSAILLTEVDNSSGQGYSGWDTSGGNNTQDNVFLLSYSEAKHYFTVRTGGNNNIQPRVAPTEYAVETGAYTNNSCETADGKAAAWWWLRSPGYGQSSAAGVSSDGSLDSNGVTGDIYVVRPVFWLNLESDIF